MSLLTHEFRGPIPAAFMFVGAVALVASGWYFLSAPLFGFGIAALVLPKQKVERRLDPSIIRQIVEGIFVAAVAWAANGYPGVAIALAVLGLVVLGGIAFWARRGPLPEPSLESQLLSPRALGSPDDRSPLG